MTTSAVSNRAQATTVAKGDTKASRQRKDNLTGWAFFTPFGIFFALFLIWPILYGLYLSFTGTTLTGAGGTFVGFANYAEALGDSDMWRAMLNTLWFTILSTIPLVVVALVMALLVDLGLPGQWLWRLSFFMPFLLASTVVSLFWIWMFNPQLGLINEMLKPFGVAPIAWLQDPQWAMLGVVIATVWWTVGFNFLLYLAALQNIPEQQYEAASLDGAGKWRQLFSITIPQLAPTTGLIVILQILASLKVFDQIFQMTQGGPAGTTRSAVVYIFDTGFTGYRFGYSAAVSFIFFAVIILISLVQIFARKGARS
jgi:multiple sugar transport system permease protein